MLFEESEMRGLNHLSSKKSRINEKPFTDKEFTKIKSDIEAKLLLIDLAG